MQIRHASIRQQAHGKQRSSDVYQEQSTTRGSFKKQREGIIYNHTMVPQMRGMKRRSISNNQPKHGPRAQHVGAIIYTPSRATKRSRAFFAATMVLAVTVVEHLTCMAWCAGTRRAPCRHARSSSTGCCTSQDDTMLGGSHCSELVLSSMLLATTCAAPRSRIAHTKANHPGEPATQDELIKSRVRMSGEFVLH